MSRTGWIVFVGLFLFTAMGGSTAFLYTISRYEAQMTTSFANLNGQLAEQAANDFALRIGQFQEQLRLIGYSAAVAGARSTDLYNKGLAPGQLENICKEQADNQEHAKRQHADTYSR